MEVLESDRKTAEAGSSIRTFFNGSKLPRLEVLRSRCKTADIGSFTVSFQHPHPFFHIFSQNCRPWKLYGHFRVTTHFTKLKMLQNCQPRQFYGHFCVFTQELQTLEVLRSVFSDVKHLVEKLQTLEVIRSLFCDDKN